jgi:hypothetical protein
MGGSVLHSELVGPRHHFIIVSTILGATDGGIRSVASHATRRTAVIYLAPLSGRLARHENGEVGGAWLAACPSPKARGYCMPCAPNQHAREARARVCGAGGNALPPRAQARIGRSGSRSRVVFVVAEVDGWLSWRREASGSTSHFLEPFGDGRLNVGPGVRKHERPGVTGHWRWVGAETLT